MILNKFKLLLLFFCFLFTPLMLLGQEEPLIDSQPEILFEYGFREGFGDNNEWCERFVAECFNCGEVYSLYVIKDHKGSHALIINSNETAAEAVSLNSEMYRILPHKYQTQDLDLVACIR